MSVTFAMSITEADTHGWTVDCPDRLVDATEASPTSLARAREMCAAHSLTCPGEDCRYYGPNALHVPAAGFRDDLDVNVSNQNAPFLLANLGMRTSTDGEYLVGSCDATTFLGAVRLAEAIAPDDAGQLARTLDRHDSTEEGVSPLVRALIASDAKVVDCGRPEGYLQDRLVELARLAEAAVAAGRKVAWA